MQRSGLVDVDTIRLLWSVAEQLKTPLTIMARQAELAQFMPERGLDPELVSSQALTALTLVDNYMLGLKLLTSQEALALEPVSVSSTLVDVAHLLDRFCRQYSVTLELQIGGRYEPVMANRPALHAALVSLGFSLAESLAAVPGAVHNLTLAVHRTAHGIVAGLYGPFGLTAAEWQRALQLQGVAGQPMPTVSTTAAGIFVANALGQAMDTKLRVGRHARSTGLAMTLLPSQQLQLI